MHRVLLPATGRLHAFTSDHAWCFADHRDHVALLVRRDLENAVAALLVVKRHPLHDAAQDIGFRRIGGWQGHGAIIPRECARVKLSDSGTAMPAAGSDAYAALGLAASPDARA